MRTFLVSLLLVLGVAAEAQVVRPAPDFSWQGGGQRVTARSLRGQPIVLLVADSPRSGAFKKQVKRFRELYQQFAARKAVFAAAFLKNSGEVRSDIPFVVVNNGPEVAAAYQAERGFTLFVIGPDGNIDLDTQKVVPASRVRDVINNAAPVQTQKRPALMR